jgi:hypothetical protein
MTKLVSIAAAAALSAVAMSTFAHAHSYPGFHVTEVGPVTAKGGIVLAHGVHTSCQNGPTLPNDAGPSSYHTSPEAGVHISCRPPPKGPKPEFAPGQSGGQGGTNGPVMRQ